MKQSKPKYQYEIDPYNNLVLVSGTRSSAKYFRKVIKGKFRVNKDNHLEYLVRQPSDNSDIPKVIRVSGMWSLTREHDLQLTISQDNKSTSRKVVLKGQLFKTGKNSLSFALTQKQANNKSRVYVIDLKGKWNLDKYNRIVFSVKKEKGVFDELVFCCAWHKNEDHRIVYEYVKDQKEEDVVKKHSLILTGTWKVTEKNRISYDINASTGSVLDIRTSFQKVEGNVIKMEMGIGAGIHKKVTELVFFGKWKILKKAQIAFEFNTNNARQKYLKFGYETDVLGSDISIKLKKYMSSKDLDIVVKIKKKIDSIDGQLFGQVLKNEKEKAVFIGVGGRF